LVLEVYIVSKVNWFMSNVILAMGLLILWGSSLNAQVEEEVIVHDRNILVIYSENQQSSEVETYNNDIKEEFLSVTERGVRLFSECLDQTRLERKLSRKAFIDYLLNKYQGIVFDSIICVGEGAYEVMAESYKVYSSTIPILYMNVDEHLVEKEKHFIGIGVDIPFEELFSTITALNSDVRKINIYANKQLNLRAYKEQLDQLSDKYHVRYQTYTEMKAENYLEDIAQGTNREGVIILSSLYKANKEIYLLEDFLKRVGQQGESLIFATSDVYVGHGAIGSVGYDKNEYMSKSIELLCHKLNKDIVDETEKIKGDLKEKVTIDYKKLKALGLKTNQIRGTITFINRPIFLEIIRMYAKEALIIGLTLISIMLIFTVTNLLKRLEIAKEHKKTRKDLKLSYIELEKAHKKLIESEGSLFNQFQILQEKKGALKISRERYRLAANGSEFGIWDYDFSRNQLYFSNKAKTILGIEGGSQEFVLYDAYRRLDKYQGGAIKTAIEKHVKRETDILECTIQMDIEGKKEWISVRGKALFNQEDQPIQMAGSLINMTKEKNAEEEIRKIAFYDEMTGLYNRAYFNNKIEILVEEKICCVAMLVIDLDNFKIINDTMGHKAGDDILYKSGQLIKQYVEGKHDVIRSSGDEFILLLESYRDRLEIEKIAHGLVELFRKLYKEKSSTTISIGISICNDHCSNLEVLLKHADLALNEVKNQGRDNYMFYDQRLKERLEEELDDEKRLLEAVEEEAFELYYQPKVSLKDHIIIGYEALIRWHHPEKGLVTPDYFMEQAEEKGIIIPIGKWVIQEAINQLESWYKMGHSHLTMSINLSAKQFQEIGLLPTIHQAMENKQIKPEQIEFEITETIALHDIDYAISLLEQLRDEGYRIALDDFGTGYSSLNYLSLLPIDTLKIDKTFVARIAADKENQQIIKMVIQLAHIHQLSVVAEGVETLEQLEFLKSEECDAIQGYYISRPVEAVEAIQLGKRAFLETLQIEKL